MLTMRHNSPAWFGRADMHFFGKYFRYVTQRLDINSFEQSVEVRFNSKLRKGGLGCFNNLLIDCLQIEVGKMSLVKSMFTLGHEMIHAKQLLRKEHRIVERPDGVIFKGAFFSLEYVENVMRALEAGDPRAEQAYLNLPWEKEAHGLDDKMLKEFMSMQEREAVEYMIRDERLLKAA